MPVTDSPIGHATDRRAICSRRCTDMHPSTRAGPADPWTSDSWMTPPVGPPHAGLLARGGPQTWADRAPPWR